MIAMESSAFIINHDAFSFEYIIQRAKDGPVRGPVWETLVARFEKELTR